MSSAHHIDADRLDHAGPFCHAQAEAQGLVLYFQRTKLVLSGDYRLEDRGGTPGPSTGTHRLYVLENGTRLCEDCYRNDRQENPLDTGPYVDRIVLSSVLICDQCLTGPV